MSPSHLPSEAARLAALQAILDTLPEVRFDRIVRLAARLFDVPMAHLAFVDASRRWVKASVGTVPGTSSRERTLCDLALDHEEVLVIADTERDPRCAGHPFVTENPQIRFYAAAPIRTPDGHAIGTLCLMDDRPRSLGPGQQAALQDLAAWVMEELERPGESGIPAASPDLSQRHAEEELNRRDRLLQGVARATHALLAVDDFSLALYQAFQLLQASADVDRVYLFENHRNPETGELLMSQRYEWPRSSIGPEFDHPGFQDIPYSALPGWEQVLRDGTPIHGPVSRFSDTVREILEAMGTRSILVVPIFIEDHFWGYIGFDDCSDERIWSEGEKSTLLAAANSVGAAYVRERAKTALAESQAQYRSVVESVREVIFQLNEDGCWAFLNAAWTEVTGFRVEESIGRSYQEYVLADDQPAVAALRAYRRIGQDEPRTCEVRFRTKDGGYRWIEMQARRTAQGTGIAGTLYDITERRQAKDALQRANDELERRVAERTIALSEANKRLLVELAERKRAEEALRRSEQKLSLHVQQSPVAFIEWNLNLRVAEWNPAAEHIFGYTREQALGQPVELLVPPPQRKAEEARWDALLSQQGSTYGISQNRTSDGRLITCEWINTPLIDEQGDIIGVASLAQDITERRRAEAKIREQAALLDKAQDAICVIGLDRTIRYWNKSAERLYGWSADEVAGRDALDLLFDADDTHFEVAQTTVLEEEEWIGEMEQVNKAGRDLVVESRWTLVRDEAGTPSAMLVVNTDISEKRALEAQFLRAQRMESLGTLASGIAHDLNNVLGPVLMSAQLLKMRFTDERNRKLLDTLELSAQRGADLVKQVLAFARGADGERVTVHLKSLVGEIARIIQDTFPRSIAIETHLADDLHPVEGDVTQLHQVVMNLCVNARDAMPDGGTLVVWVANVDVDARQARLQMDAQPGTYVLISVRDTGTGMPPEVMDKIFEPFYTTKENGTGLGLSTSVGIVKGHGGFISVRSELGVGTEFEVYLPIGHGLHTRPTMKRSGTTPKGAGECILVVDDEEPLRMVAREVLEANGYQVMTAANGAEGIECYARHDKPIAAVVTDLMMPVMDGYAMVRALYRIDPSIRVVATSGLANQDQLRAETGVDVGAFLPKPYKAEQLLQVLHQVLHGDADKPEAPEAAAPSSSHSNQA